MLMLLILFVTRCHTHIDGTDGSERKKLLLKSPKSDLTNELLNPNTWITRIAEGKAIGAGSYGLLTKITGKNGAIGAIVVKEIKKEKVQVAEVIHEIRMQAKAYEAAPSFVPKINQRYIESKEKLFILMEFIDGEDLRKLWTNPHWVADNFDNVMNEVTQAVAQFRVNNLKHGDLKPDNIRINSKGEVKIIDFGLAGERNDTIDEFAIAKMREKAMQGTEIKEDDNSISEQLNDYRQNESRFSRI